MGTFHHGGTIMNRKTLVTTLSLLLSSALIGSTAWAAKPEMAGQSMNKEERATMKEERKQQRVTEPENGTTTRSQMENEERERQREMDGDKAGQDRDKRERMQEKEGMDNKGMEKQREMKSEQEMKELGKGSEKGQESREKRKKWWRFWE